jgi:hypothetical protein
VRWPALGSTGGGGFIEQGGGRGDSPKLQGSDGGGKEGGTVRRHSSMAMALRWAAVKMEGPTAHSRRGEIETLAKTGGKRRGGAHRERADGGAAAPNPACPVVDSGGGAVKWH